MKKITILVTIIILSLVLGTALPAFASEGPEKVKPNATTPLDKDAIRSVKPLNKASALKPNIVNAIKLKTLKGEIKAVSSSSVTIGETEVFVDDSTKINIPTMRKEATLADIKVSMLVVALLYEKEGVLFAKHINVIPGKPIEMHYVGVVTEYSYTEADGGKIAIKAKNEAVYTFTILAGKFKILPQGAEVKVGATVTVISRRNLTTASAAASAELIAEVVVVHKPVVRPVTGKISGTITAIDEAAKTITIDQTVLTYNESTVFTLKGILAVAINQKAVAVYAEKDSAKIAIKVAVGIETEDDVEEAANITLSNVVKA